MQRLLSITHYPALLGANRSLLHLLEGLKLYYKLDILVFCPAEGPFTEALAAKGIPYRIIPFANWAYTIRSKNLLFFPWKWRQHLNHTLPLALEQAREFNPDMLHSNSSAVSLGWQLAETLHKAHVWHIREFGWRDYQLVFPLGASLLKAKLAVAARVIFISGAIQNAYASMVSAPSFVLYNGVGTRARIEGDRPVNEAPALPPIFLLIGLLQPSKGQHDAIRAFVQVRKKMPESRLLIAGTGRKLYTLWLKYLVWRYQLQANISFTGYVNNPAELYRRAAIVLMCSRNEAMGRVTAEAMSFGKPVIGYDGGATPEIVKAGETGFLYQGVNALAERMIQLGSQPELRREMGQKAWQFALEQFSDEAYVGKFYRELSRIEG
jgi:glycosyltransferase involved in cell wall biosynthesis